MVLRCEDVYTIHAVALHAHDQTLNIIEDESCIQYNSCKDTPIPDNHLLSSSTPFEFTHIHVTNCQIYSSSHSLSS